MVASDLPGVRHAVRATGMGEIVPIADAAALAAAVGRVLEGPARYVIPRAEVGARLGLDEVFDASKRSSTRSAGAAVGRASTLRDKDADRLHAVPPGDLLPPA